MPVRSFRSWIALVCLTLLVTACGGGSGGGNSSSDSSTSSTGTVSSSSTSSGTTSTSTSTTAAPTPTSITYPVQLAWTAPSTRADGTALSASELTGYRVYYSLEGSSASADTVLPVSGGTATSLTINLTAAGTYAFAITAIDQNGLESSLSAPVLVAVN